MSPNTVAAGVGSGIPRGLYPGMIDLGAVANDLVFSSDGALAYASTRDGISVIRTSDWVELSVLDAPGEPFGVTLINGGTRLAVALNNSDSVVEIDLATGASLMQVVLVVIDEFGEVAVEQEAGNSDSPIWSSFSTWVLEGDYLVVLLRPADVSGWPYVPTTNSGHALLERGVTPIRVEGETLVRITAPPFP